LNRLARAEVRNWILHYIALILNILLTAAHYHMSALSGQEWVVELIVGHPEHIRCELGVHAYVFESLVEELCALGHTNSQYVSLEEQLAIFLYTCLTGLTIRHVGEHSQ
jgi:phosphate starvation-inducible membrane PsiE